MSNSNKVKCSDCILDISIGNGLKEKAIETNFFLKALGESPTVSFKEALQLIERAKSDDQIKAISINGTSYLDLTQTIDLTEAIKTFKVSGKDVFAYGDFYTQPGFMLATQADSSFIHPMGNLSLTGFEYGSL
jgi:protease-4